MSSMISLRDQRGAGNVLLVPFILLVLLFIGAAAFAVWAYGGRQDYKNNVDAKVQAAVAQNTKTVQAADAQQYAEAAKSPLKTYVGPEAYGSIHVLYPKTWSAYVVTDGDTPFDAYFHPDVVPAVDADSSTFALRIQVADSAYSDTLSNFQDQASQGTAKLTPYKLPQVPSVTGVRIDGQIDDTHKGSMIILPLRDKTLQIWTETDNNLNDFNNYILPNISFSP